MEDSSRPCPAQLALALAIAKTKPPSLDIKEYILQIRENIKTSRGAQISDTPELFFDSVAFWKNAYEKSEAENSKLLDRTFELEQRNDALLAKQRSKEDPGSEVKRQIASKQPAARRAQTLLPPGNSAVAALCGLDGNTTGLLDGLTTGPFMRQYFTLQKVLQKRPLNTNIVQAAIPLCKTIEADLERALPREITKNKSRKPALTQPKKSHLTQTLHGVESAMALLLQALRKLSASADTNRELLTYHIISLYETLLQTLTQYCTMVSMHLPSTEPETNRRLRRSKQPLPTPETDTNSPLDPTATHITSLLSLIISSLDLTHQAHHPLLEALISILLTRTGKFLSLFTFKDLQLRPDLRIDPSKLSHPAGLEGMSLDEKTIRAAEVEVRHLIPLLRSALAIFDITESTLSTSGTTEIEGFPRSKFLTSVKGRLQSTLIQAVYGSDPNLGRTLRRPVQPQDMEIEIESLFDGQRESELPVSEWYVREVWELVGWDILIRGEEGKLGLGEGMCP
ncbi:hypothetical protein BJY04DRAFT_212448 [Aspergillus karnatakaensis]|uniref:uncharacterized protein n=1 Tax=Aspergillus karnatakaensis TaxID=1810916 RepID=UPI003CCD0F94